MQIAFAVLIRHGLEVLFLIFKTSPIIRLTYPAAALAGNDTKLIIILQDA